MMSTIFAAVLFYVPGAEPPREVDPFEAALVAAVHHFAEDGELGHLKAIVAKFPKIVNARQTYRQPRKPTRVDDFTALHFAAEGGREEIAAFLIEKGADVNATAGLDWTPLHLAAERGHLDLVKLLVKHRAKIDAKTTAVPERFGIPPGSDESAKPRLIPGIPSLTPLDLARERKQAAVVEFLKTAGR